jgi:phenylpyruvate tautomerase PptA (4-oxalocrotonate tautomerase family)
VTRAAATTLVCKPEDVDVIFTEVVRHDWWSRNHPPERKP